MPTHYSRIFRFWQELKRRKVIQVITVYAASAFVILELADILAPSLRLPEWTLNLVLLLLCVGFVIAVILSWMYDIHPERGMVKTEPSQKTKAKEISRPTNSWKIASYISFAVIVGLLTLHLTSRFSKTKARESLDKSIAVLPFRNESSDEQNAYFINGTMEAILDNLCKIKDLRVPGRTSMEQYRELAKAIPLIAEEMHVSYILEGSGQKMGNRILLTVQLLDGKNDRHLWSRQYDRIIESVEDLIDIQSEIARLIAGEIEAIITPDEEELINRLPTNSLAAYNLYLEANEFRKKYNETRDLAAYQTAVNLYNLSLKTDPGFAKAYTGLAWTYNDRFFWPEFFTDNFLDSCLVMVKLALSIDDRLEEAYYLKGYYYEMNGDLEPAIDNYDRVIEIDPNYYLAYRRRGNLLASVLADNVRGLKDYHKALSLVTIEERPSSLRKIASAYAGLGFADIARDYIQECLALDSNLLLYYASLGWWEFYQENYDGALQMMKEAHRLDTSFLFNLHFYIYASNPDFQEAYEDAQKWITRAERTGVPIYFQSHRIGYIYYKLGRIEEANEFFRQQIDYSERSISLSRFYAQGKAAQYDLAATIAFLGDKEEAYRRLDDMNTLGYFGLDMISFVKGDPLFESIRNETRFQKIVQDMESKNRAERERVRQWLEQQGML